MATVAWSVALLIVFNALLTAALWIVRAGERREQSGHGERDTGNGQSGAALADLERVR